MLTQPILLMLKLFFFTFHVFLYIVLCNVFLLFNQINTLKTIKFNTLLKEKSYSCDISGGGFKLHSTEVHKVQLTCESY